MTKTKQTTTKRSTEHINRRRQRKHFIDYLATGLAKEIANMFFFFSRWPI